MFTELDRLLENSTNSHLIGPMNVEGHRGRVLDELPKDVRGEDIGRAFEGYARPAEDATELLSSCSGNFEAMKEPVETFELLESLGAKL